MTAHDAARPVPAAVLVRICDLAGRLRGTGFVADELGTVVTGHEVVDGLTRLVLHAPGDRTCLAEADAITPLPEHGLALVRTEDLGVRPLPVTARAKVAAGTYVRLVAGGWREARVLGTAPVTYTATDRFHLLDSAMELAMGTAGSDALRLGGEAAGGPVLDAATGAVLAVIGTSLLPQIPGTVPADQAPQQPRAAGLAVPLGPGGAHDGPLGTLLRRNAATVPAYGADLNLAGALQLTATSVGSEGGPAQWPEPVERHCLSREFDAFTTGPAQVLGLVGAPGTGRTTELRALAARRTHGPVPGPTVWLRGADLRDEDTSVADALARTLARAGRVVAASGTPGDMTVATPERVARLAGDAGRPLLVLLDAPEEMPPVLAHRLAEWTAGTADWLRTHAARLVVACRPEHWEQAGALYPRHALHPVPAPRLPPAVLVGDLDEPEAAVARERYGIGHDALGPADGRHPLTLRLLAEVRAALPDGPAAPARPDREEVFEAHLALLCLRIAVRVAAARRPAVRGRAVRRLAAETSGRVHEAARRCLGPGQGELARRAFEEIFPWRTGWASAVLTEGLIVPAGGGYRFAHEELADWVQGAHLDLAEATEDLVHRPGTREVPVPRHRIGPVIEAMLLLERHHGVTELALRLRELIATLETTDSADAQWWGSRLLFGTLLRVRDVGAYGDVLRELAEAVTARSLREGGPRGLGGLGSFGPWFWERLELDGAERLDLLRILVLADGAPRTPTAAPDDRYLDSVARLLVADVRRTQLLLCDWFGDGRELPGGAGVTVAEVAQALLHTHRGPAVDDLAETLVEAAHPRADELLRVLCADEPSAMCRAVGRWAHDERAERRVAAASYASVVDPHAVLGADRELLRSGCTALLGRPGDLSLHGAALALLVRDPVSRSRFLPRAVAAFTVGEPRVPARALAAALATHPDPVLAALRGGLYADGCTPGPRTPGPGAGGPGADGPLPGEERTREVLRALAAVDTPALARRAAALVAEYVARRPEGAVLAASFVEERLESGPGVRDVLFPLVSGMLRSGPRQVREALAPVLAAPGTPRSGPLRAELLDVLLQYEEFPHEEHARDYEFPVLAAVLRSAAHGAAERHPERTRELVRRAGKLLVRTPEGAACFDRRLVALAREVPRFGAQLAGWLATAPEDWAAVVGPSSRRMVQTLAEAAVPHPRDGGTDAGHRAWAWQS
ncbi:trypsin-like peptidase domain-containing protein [Streptomyces sp. NPDC004111]|uniref:trypsin-like peptidase domain-containing protein n=1 Tax=Streptomyces sp. NPDC004111 TaxID=3364690 RepID=UPI00369AFC90